ncbi:hypothetical protein MLD38_004811 [Melastoma candidum]|uniref:Uncharacterized protein n=1 Tax=Melastoma candidum TaxID=119954 RepID=A0ACB9S6L8_9MYRT|nr:hypothetical protein MLD38_004811 [Melastoma candidum]
MVTSNTSGAKFGRGGGGGTTYWVISEKVLNTIRSIKEIVKNHSDDEIYAALKECNMDPNETAQKLLNQDPFHEVKRRRDRKKENAPERDAVNLPKPPENDQILKISTQVGRNYHGGYSRSYLPPDAGTLRNVLPASKGFRVVRDSRVNQQSTGEAESASQQPRGPSFQRAGYAMARRGTTGTSIAQKPLAERSHSYVSKEASGFRGQNFPSSLSNGSSQKGAVERERATVSSSVLRVRAVKSGNSQSHPVTSGSSNPLVGLYSSSTDPVHVPSPDSRSSSVVGTIKCDVGAVGGRRQTSEDSTKQPSTPDSSSTSHSPAAVSKDEQLFQNGLTQSATSSLPGSRSLLSNQYVVKPNTTGGSHKAPQPVKEWKPKSVPKLDFSSPGIIGSPPKSGSDSLNGAKESNHEAVKLPDRLSELNIHPNQNVIIAQHIRVPDSDRYQLIFGSFDGEFDSSRNFVNGDAKDDFKEEITTSFPVSNPPSCDDNESRNKQADAIEEQLSNSSSNSSTSPVSSENQLPDKKAGVPQNLDNMGLIGLVRGGGRSFSPPGSGSQQLQQDPPEMANFSGYDALAGYDMAYFRTSVDEPVQMQGLPSQEALASHMANSLPATTMPLGGQPHPQAMAQMYPQVHVSQYANMVPYRQFISPVYMSPMALPSYSGGSPTVFANFANHTGYSMNSAGVVGNAPGLDDSSRVKYKDGNLYIPNPQVEASEMWIQTPREVPGMQSAQYYNLPGQATPHATYLSHAGHAPFNSGAPQSSHMQFPGWYHPSPQPPSAIASAHHLNPSMAGNLGVGMAMATPRRPSRGLSATSVGAYDLDI